MSAKLVKSYKDVELRSQMDWRGCEGEEKGGGGVRGGRERGRERERRKKKKKLSLIHI